MKIARWEFLKNIKSPVFLVLTILIPVLMVGGGLAGYYGMAGAMKEKRQVAVIDDTGELFSILEGCLVTTPVRATLHTAAERNRLIEEVREGRYNGYLHFTDEAALKGEILYYVKDTREQITPALAEGVRR
jgi:ABC-type Na+ efflux pump permease subunit